MYTQFNTVVAKSARNVDLTFQLGSFGTGSKLSSTTPAIEAMTSFQKYHGLAIKGDVQLDRVAAAMQDFGVSFAIVVDEAGRLRGVLDITDVFGEKPMQVARKRDIIHAELLVEDVMTMQNSMVIFALSDLKHLTVAGLFQRLKAANRQYGIVIDNVSPDRDQLAGIFSLREMARGLNQNYLPLASTGSFAEIEAAIAA